VCTYVWISN